MGIQTCCKTIICINITWNSRQSWIEVDWACSPRNEILNLLVESNSWIYCYIHVVYKRTGAHLEDWLKTGPSIHHQTPKSHEFYYCIHYFFVEKEEFQISLNHLSGCLLSINMLLNWDRLTSRHCIFGHFIFWKGQQFRILYFLVLSEIE